MADAADDATPITSLPLEWLPWHDGARSRLETALAGGRLPHGLLLHGPDGVGKEHFAAVLAAGLFCTGRGPGVTPCGACPECALSRAASHSDLHWLRRPEDKKSIGVDAVREACEQLAMTSMRGGYRVAIVTPAHLMTTNAQNALLKTLEEPAPRTLLVLVTSRPSGLLATLRSRCQRIEVPRPPAAVASAWLGHELGATPPAGLLELAGGAPLKALALAPHFSDLEAQMTTPARGSARRTHRSHPGRRRDDGRGPAGHGSTGSSPGWREAVRARTVPGATRLTVPGGRCCKGAPPK